jgi:hypothetical protein
MVVRTSPSPCCLGPCPERAIANRTLHQLGRLTHYAFDAVLSILYSSFLGLSLADSPKDFLTDASNYTVSAFLAGIKRSTGLT